MISLKECAIAFAVAAILAIIITPISIKLALKTGVVTVPDDGRRMHARNIPRLGGLAIFAASSIAMLILGGGNDKVYVILFGGALIYALGVFDDIKNIKPWVKLMGQVAIFILMYVMGIRVGSIHNYFGTGILYFNEIANFLISLAWMIVITNSINLIDGLDGLAAGTVAIDALCMAYISYIAFQITGNGRMTVCLAMLSIAGACIGFLPYNFSPARTFMGDGGSLYLGFMMAAFSTVGQFKSSTVITMILPIFVLALPVFDTLFAVIRRTISHKSILDADRGHIHHFLVDSGHGHQRSVLMLYCLSGIMCMAAVLICRKLYYDSAILMAIAVTFIYVFLTDKIDKKSK